jgi:hypothetical protein
MNTKSTAINGDAGTEPGSTTAATAAPASIPAPAAVSAAALALERAKKKPHEPAFVEPAKKPAVPRDEYHGKGGMYAIVDGKRVPCDDTGKPLPPKVDEKA